MLATRVARALRVGRKPLATFYYQATPATTYWRVTLPAKYLPGSVHPAARLMVRHHQGTDRLEFPDVANDTAIMQFPGDQGTAVVAMAMESQGKKLFVEIDDNYSDAGDPIWRKRSGWGPTIGKTPHTVQGHRWIVQHAYGVITTTRALAESYRELNDNVHVCRNSIDPDDWPEPAESDETFRIGWYASQSHDRDEEQVRRAMSWASRQPNVEIVNIGLDPGWAFRRRWIGWKDNFREHRQELRKLDVGISPLIGTPMTKYRSDLKALEYAMGGAMPMLQSSEPYWEWRDKEFARICSTEADWAAAIKWAVRNRDEVRARGRQAREYVLAERTFHTEIERWREAIGGGRA